MMTTTADGWLQHSFGLARLVELQGPHAFTEPKALALFESLRFTIIIAYLYRRRPTFLADHAWKTIPWSANPLTKPSMQQLLDIMAEVPGLLNKSFGVAFDTDHIPSVHTRNFWSRVLQACNLLHHWRQHWELNNGIDACEIAY